MDDGAKVHKRVPGNIYLVFDGPTGPEGPRFIEAEDHAGKSIRVGEWVCLDDGNWALKLPRSTDLSMSRKVSTWGELRDQTKDIPDDAELAVRIDLSKADDPNTEDHRAHGEELIEVMCVRTHPNGPIYHACIFVDGELEGFG